MRIFSLAAAAGVACFLASGGAASAACKATPNSLFEDQFNQLDETWGSYENYDVEDGKLVIKPPAGYNTSTINNSSLYDDVDICVEMSAEAPVQEGSCGSIIFWALDFDNYYSFQVSTEGQASFWRRQRGRWLNQASWQDAAGTEKGATVINELRVVTSGKTAKLYINGTLFKEVKGQPPKDGSLIGLLACSPNEASAHITFDNLVVNPPSAEPIAEKTRGEASGGDNGGSAGAAGGGATDDKSGAKPAGSDNDGAPSIGAGAPGGDGSAAPANGGGAAPASGGGAAPSGGGGDSGPANGGTGGSDGGGGTGGGSPGK